MMARDIRVGDDRASRTGCDFGDERAAFGKEIVADYDVVAPTRQLDADIDAITSLASCSMYRAR